MQLHLTMRSKKTAVHHYPGVQEGTSPLYLKISSYLTPLCPSVVSPGYPDPTSSAWRRRVSTRVGTGAAV